MSNQMGRSRHSFERAQSSDYIVVAVNITKPRWSVTLGPRQHDYDMRIYFLCLKLSRNNVTVNWGSYKTWP